MSDEHPHNTGIIFAALTLVLLLATLDQTIVATALPTIVDNLGGLDHLSWVAAAYLLASMVVGPIYGKLGDLYGRKITLQAAICLFLLGSALCGISHSMLELVLFRALQGAGGGGLVVTVMAVIGDLVPARDRGKYQGFFGVVIGVSTVAGPLLGGYFVEHLSWRWIFYINLPLGLVALSVIAIAFKTPVTRRELSVDYLGALLLTAMLTCVMLLADPGGATLAATSSQTFGLIVLTLGLLIAFIVVERRAPEPIVPLKLFRNPIFAVCCSMSLVVGVAMFGAVTFLPLYMQVVKGMSPSLSGLQLIPMTGGMIVASAVSGVMISRFGFYKIFPIIGLFLVSGAYWMLFNNLADAGKLAVSIYLLTLGFGLGLTMQVLVLAAQNAVPQEELGVATSGIVLFRSLGGSLGVSAFGTIFTNGLQSALEQLAPHGLSYAVATNIGQLRSLPESQLSLYIAAYVSALKPLFLVAGIFSAAGFVLALLLREKPLPTTLVSRAES